MAGDDAPHSPRPTPPPKGANTPAVPHRDEPRKGHRIAVPKIPRSRTTPFLPNLAPDADASRSTRALLSPTKIRSRSTDKSWWDGYEKDLDMDAYNDERSLGAKQNMKDRFGNFEKFKAPNSPLPAEALDSPKALKLLGFEELAEVQDQETKRRSQDTHVPRKGDPYPKPIQDKIDERIEAKFKKQQEREEKANPLIDRFIEKTKTNALKKASKVLDFTRPKGSGKTPIPPLPPLPSDVGQSSNVYDRNKSGKLRRPPHKLKSASRTGGYRSKSGRKLRQKRLQPMNPLTEVSSDPDSGVADDVEGSDGDYESDSSDSDKGDDELEFISEYEQAPYEVHPGRRVVTPPPERSDLRDDELSHSPHSGFEINDDSDDVFYEAPPIPEKSAHRTPKIAQDDQEAYVVHPKSPLQRVEDVLLDNAEKKLKIDEETAPLLDSHLQMKEDMKNVKRNSGVLDAIDEVDESYDQSWYDSGSDFDTDDSDTYLGEEAVIETATPMTITPVPMRDVKLVVYPPRTSSMPTREVNAISRQASLKTVFPFKGENASPAPYPARKDSLPRKPVATPTKNRPPPLSLREPGSPSYRPSSIYGSATRSPERKRIVTPTALSAPRTEAWMDTTNPRLSERPYSVFDEDVVTDRFLDTIPNPSSTSGQCLPDAHVFTMIEARRIQDYLTSTPTRRHVRVVSSCGVCGQELGGVYSQCDIVGCKLAVCCGCGQEMQTSGEQVAKEGRVSVLGGDRE